MHSAFALDSTTHLHLELRREESPNNNLRFLSTCYPLSADEESSAARASNKEDRLDPNMHHRRTFPSSFTSTDLTNLAQEDEKVHGEENERTHWL